MNGYNINVTGHSHPRFEDATLCGICGRKIPAFVRCQMLRMTVDGTAVRVIICGHCAPIPEGIA